MAAGLAATGVGRGDRVVLRLRNTGEFVLALLGALRAGAIAVPTIRQYSPDELRFALEDSEAACLIFDDSERAPIEAVVPAGVAIFHAGAADEPGAALAELRGAEASGEERGVERPPGDLDAFEDALIFYTSGTTSRPKGVVLSHGAILAAGLNNAEGWRLRASDRSYVVLPLFHCNALFMQLVPALLSRGDRDPRRPLQRQPLSRRVPRAPDHARQPHRRGDPQPARPARRRRRPRTRDPPADLRAAAARRGDRGGRSALGFPVRMCSA